MDLTSPLTRTAAGLARRTLVPPLVVLDQRVVVPVLGERSPVHKVLAAVADAVSAVMSAPNPSPAPRAAQDSPPAPVPTRDADEEEDQAASQGEAEEPVEPGQLTEDEQERIERLTEQLLEQERDEQFVGELADEELRRAQATIRAKQIIEEEDRRLGEDDGANGGS